MGRILRQVFLLVIWGAASSDEERGSPESRIRLAADTRPSSRRLEICASNARVEKGLELVNLKASDST
jgi:hypothetical protein